MSSKTRLLSWLSVVMLSASVASAQQPSAPGERQIPDAAYAEAQGAESGEAGRERPGGHPLPADANAEREQQGTEEGLPPAARDIQPRTNDAPYQSEGFPDRRIVRPRWQLGVHAYNTRSGVVLTQVVRGSAAFQAGLERGDRIVTVNGYQVGIVDDRLFYLGEELQRRADRRGRVLLLVENVRNSELINIDVQMTSYGSPVIRNRFPYQRFPEPQSAFPPSDSGDRSR